jgi:hypothetical protein
MEMDKQTVNIVADRIPKPGSMWRHFKGKDYVVKDIAKHTDDLDTLVLYIDPFRPWELWARPLSQWHEGVKKSPGLTCPRFTAKF